MVYRRKGFAVINF